MQNVFTRENEKGCVMETITVKELSLKYGFRVNLLRDRMCRAVFEKYRAQGKSNLFENTPKLHEQILSTMRIFEVKDKKWSSKNKALCEAHRNLRRA